MTPLFLFAALYANPSVVPLTRPKRPPRLGPWLGVGWRVRGQDGCDTKRLKK